MFQYSTDEVAGVVHLVVNRRSTFDDYQTTLPELLGKLKQPKFDKLLLEIRSLDEPADYIDPDLTFSTLNDIKGCISKMAVVCPGDLSDEVENMVRPVRNWGKPVQQFPDITEAFDWLSPGAEVLQH